MASSSVLIKLLVVVGCAAAASAATLTVGGNSGWTLGQNYDTWASGQTFAVGDKLVFNFVGAHTVTEVNKNDYDNCAVASNSISSTSTSPATLDLTTAGMHYYICAVSGHCAGGMKLAISVGSGSGSGTPPSTTPGSSGTPPTTPSSPSKPTGGASAGLQASAAVAAAAGVLVKLALF
uniref:Phytocyanin domain-containing protein n=1 Tax=Oryza meridionalis TaxID=40149 RepID=A0A0E0EME6_9ORYZ